MAEDYKNYRQTRNYENLQRAIFQGAGEYSIPEILAGDLDADNWISFNYAKGCEEPEQHGIHFFIDDYQFQRLWTDPDRYIPMLQRFQAVMTPDFSMYTDFPKAAQIWNHYRKHWLGAYWQLNGIKVIPTICWSDHDSYDWCFDGEPVGATVAVSSVGTQQRAETRRLFLDGYHEMLQRLQPKKIIMYGEIPVGVDSESVVSITPYQAKWREREKDGR